MTFSRAAVPGDMPTRAAPWVPSPVLRFPKRVGSAIHPEVLLRVLRRPTWAPNEWDPQGHKMLPSAPSRGLLFHLTSGWALSPNTLMPGASHPASAQGILPFPLHVASPSRVGWPPSFSSVPAAPWAAPDRALPCRPSILQVVGEQLPRGSGVGSCPLAERTSLLPGSGIALRQLVPLGAKQPCEGWRSSKPNSRSPEAMTQHSSLRSTVGSLTWPWPQVVPPGDLGWGCSHVQALGK